MPHPCQYNACSGTPGHSIPSLLSGSSSIEFRQVHVSFNLQLEEELIQAGAALIPTPRLRLGGAGSDPAM